MLSVDTNVLIRVLVDDPSAPEQCRIARQAVSDAGEVFVCQVVQTETVWVLASAYGLSKKRLRDTLAAVADHPAFHLQRRDIFRAALENYAVSSADFADCMILAESVSADCELISFDRQLGKLAGVRLLKQ